MAHTATITTRAISGLRWTTCKAVTALAQGNKYTCHVKLCPACTINRCSLYPGVARAAEAVAAEAAP